MKPSPQVDEDYRQAAAMANLAVPYRHSRLSAVKVAGDPDNPFRFDDNATADELRAEIMKRLEYWRRPALLTCRRCGRRLVESQISGLRRRSIGVPTGSKSHRELCRSVPRSAICLCQTVPVSISANAEV